MYFHNVLKKGKVQIISIDQNAPSLETAEAKLNWIFSIYDADDGGRFQKTPFSPSFTILFAASMWSRSWTWCSACSRSPRWRRIWTRSSPASRSNVLSYKTFAIRKQPKNDFFTWMSWRFLYLSFNYSIDARRYSSSMPEVVASIFI